jgi:hypothetical protein
VPLLLGASPRAPRPTNEVRGDPWLAAPIFGATGKSGNPACRIADGGPSFRIFRSNLALSPPGPFFTRD